MDREHSTTATAPYAHRHRDIHEDSDNTDPNAIVIPDNVIAHSVFHHVGHRVGNSLILEPLPLVNDGIATINGVRQRNAVDAVRFWYAAVGVLLFDVEHDFSIGPNPNVDRISRVVILVVDVDDHGSSDP